MTNQPNKSGGHYRSIFISDLHLGSKASRADEICQFLKVHTCDNLFLVGDIIDGWRLKNRWYFPQEHINVIRRILTASKRGTTVRYLIGNHDEVLRRYIDEELQLGNIYLIDEYEYTALNGQTYYIVHGDQFDTLMIDKKWIMHLGDILYDLVVWVNIQLNRLRGLFGMKYWSLSGYLKYRTKQAVKFIQRYEEHLIHYCKKHDYDGIVCGHIHAPEMRFVESVEYMNTGDFCDSCTAIVETFDGEFKMIRYNEGDFYYDD